MKWIRNKTFPHPVLSVSAVASDRDYINCEFQVTSELIPNPKDQTSRLNISCVLSENSILSLIQQGKAKYATEVHCRETFLRRLLVSE